VTIKVILAVLQFSESSASKSIAHKSGRILARICMITNMKLKCGPMPNVMVALPNVDGSLCSTLQTLADTHYSSAMQ